MKEANILKAITHNIPCDKCPFPCEAKWNSSQANCDKHWFEMLKLFSKVEWKDIMDELQETLSQNYFGEVNEMVTTAVNPSLT